MASSQITQFYTKQNLPSTVFNMTVEAKINVAVLGTGMMGQEHISYMEKYPQINVKFLCDSNREMLEKASSLISANAQKPEMFNSEKQLLERANEIDLLVIATPNYMHAPHLLRWAYHQLVILVEKPVAISEKQVQALRAASASFQAKIWVAMEYRYIPAVQKLYQLLPTIGPIKNITIRENRFPFLSKARKDLSNLFNCTNQFNALSFSLAITIPNPRSVAQVNEWNKDLEKSGDTLVEKCCHFFDLFRLLSSQEMHSCTAKIHRGLLDEEYGYDKRMDNPIPIIDSAYVLLDFKEKNDCEQSEGKQDEVRYSPSQQGTLGCLELCMFADGSRHQEEIVVTGLKGRVEAYLPENKVFHYMRPNNKHWVDKTQPPPRSSIQESVIDCSILSNVYQFADEIPQHAGHHYCSTAVEWKHLIDQVENWKKGETFTPEVSLYDGIAAVEMGMRAQRNVSNKTKEENGIFSISAFGSQSCDELLNLAIDVHVARARPHLAVHAKDLTEADGPEEEKGLH